MLSVTFEVNLRTLRNPLLKKLLRNSDKISLEKNCCKTNKVERKYSLFYFLLTK